MALQTIFLTPSTASHGVSDAVDSQVIPSGALQDGLKGPFGKIVAPNQKSKARPSKGGTHQPSAPQNKEGDVAACGGASPPFHIPENSQQNKPRLFPGQQKKIFTKI